MVCCDISSSRSQHVNYRGALLTRLNGKSANVSVSAEPRGETPHDQTQTCWQKSRRCRATNRHTTNTQRGRREQPRRNAGICFDDVLRKLTKCSCENQSEANGEHIRVLARPSPPHDATRCSATRDSAVLGWTSLAARQPCVCVCVCVCVCDCFLQQLPEDTRFLNLRDGPCVCVCVCVCVWRQLVCFV